ncbi:AAA family ATPase [Novosphingobium sp. TCA1]|uniref:AAA family ATPase n=1 Tax=Novosphingobium sp. TCA1 TaxID=2682474 RepID=UPI00135B0588|nr:AAA family ATPase [Novosphingobium sp. TCA1]
MFFRVMTAPLPPVATNCAFLFSDTWDDWFKFQTVFSLFIFDENGQKHSVGSVKISRMGLEGGSTITPGRRRPEMPEHFDTLPPGYFSLGQGEDYYETLNLMSETLRLRVLQGLRDCAFDQAIFEEARDEPSMVHSLLRGTPESSVTGRLRRLSRGDAELTPFRFAYTLPPSGPDFYPPTIDFDVIPESQPPTNVHVLIGRNGVGKSRAMRGLMQALLGRPDEVGRPGGRVRFTEMKQVGTDLAANADFPRIVLVSFSAFDDFPILAEPSDRIGVEHVGLHVADPADGRAPQRMKSPADLAKDFSQSLARCRGGLRRARWLEAVTTLETDDLFAQAEVRSLLEGEGDAWENEAQRRFRLLSSGHAIVLLTITRLVELVDERTLVLIDEPEGHLHPPLLSAFIRSLSRLLVSRNGLAVVATHSPVVLQEVPRSCVWKLRRTGYRSEAERPLVETFGENVGILTREVFGLEVTRTGFHGLLAAAVLEERLDYEGVLARFDGQLGAEARAIVRSLVIQRDAI